ncbi:hypothetical protein [Methylobacter sp.]|uniref:hypothetical protein n=1 Tax=Methylobacter sp. TaxID=2051955 RepID=UPI002488C3E1|nr:hypothetical protein [Methylobacter sp.]MDI1278285.1 hypothetical protein [Methylobacter sp.]MDI1359023.1 hypothetical protein [Methylobacter sp.]
MSTTAWMQEVEQRRSSCRGAEAFPADSGGVCRKRQFSLPLKQAYFGLQDFFGAHGTPYRNSGEPKNIKASAW